MLLEYLHKNYKTNELIFASDIKLPVSETNLRQMFKNLVDDQKLVRFDNGVYYLTNNHHHNNEINDATYAKCKYIERNGEVFGYTSGYTFANELGLTSIFPFTVEITTNNTSSKYREVYLHNLKVALRKPRVLINEDNVYILQLLDLLKDADLYIDEDIVNSKEIITAYIKKNKISKKDIDKYLYLYPDKIYRFIYELDLYDSFI